MKASCFIGGAVVLYRVKIKISATFAISNTRAVARNERRLTACLVSSAQTKEAAMSGPKASNIVAKPKNLHSDPIRKRRGNDVGATGAAAATRK